MEIETRKAWQDRLTWPMFVLSFAFLVLLGGVLQRREALDSGWNALEAWILLGGLGVFWPIFWIETLFRWRLRVPELRSAGAAWFSLAIALFPPLRMGAHSVTERDCYWLPRLGWRKIDYDLQKTLERAFSGPMLFMALLILPVLALEYYAADAVDESLGIVIYGSVSLIWIAFTTEFIIRMAAAEKKMSYAVTHWIDLAIVLFPMVEFLPFLRIFRASKLIRLKSVARLAKYYRLYGVAGKTWHGLVTLRMITALVRRSRSDRLNLLRSQMAEKQEQLRDLEREIDYYRRRIEALEKEEES